MKPILQVFIAFVLVLSVGFGQTNPAPVQQKQAKKATMAKKQRVALPKSPKKEEMKPTQETAKPTEQPKPEEKSEMRQKKDQAKQKADQLKEDLTKKFKKD